jgi:catechol 2,3-dioxygenase-like lactoylglutathione lyase family enzyme
MRIRKDAAQKPKGSAMPQVTGVLETALHVDDIRRASAFYEDLFGFRKLDGDGDRFCAYSVADRQVLLLFKRGGTTRPIALPGGVVPPHGGSGSLHFAFSVPASDLDAWEERLASRGIAIESRVRWERGGRSIYFRDLDGHLLELVTPGCWAIY